MEKVNIALIGAGGWGSNILRALSRIDSARLKMVCDTDKGKEQAIKRQYPGVDFTTNYKDVEKNTAIDAVVIATPSPAHAKMAETFLLSKRAVFVEKPMALTIKEALGIVELTEKGMGPLMVGHLLIYHPATAILKQTVDDRTIGDIYYIYSKRLNLGVVRQNENALWSLAPHDISVILHLVGKMPDSISAHGSSYLTKDIEDVVFVQLFFPDGKIAQIHVSWLDPHKERKLVVVGSKKMVVFDDMQANEKIRIYNKGADVSAGEGDEGGKGVGGEERRGGGGGGVANFIESISIRHGEITIPAVPPREPLMEEMLHFIDCVKGNKKPTSGAKEGMEVVKILTSASESMASGGKVVGL